METQYPSESGLAEAITRAASKQTYFTIRFLVDRDRRSDAYRAYAYFRWVDDWLDIETRTRSQRLAFVHRQQQLVDHCYQASLPAYLSPEEHLLVELVRNNPQRGSGLEIYIRNMMAVMAFDADRRGRLITEKELENYTYWLASAVTEAMHYFIGHDEYAPMDDSRYTAVTGAHITHLLRDTLEDIEAGYFNLPRERSGRSAVTTDLVLNPLYQDWVKENVSKARSCFQAGREYMARVENLRCRLAGYAYMYRFEVVLRFIEREGYCLRAGYPERKTGWCCIQMLGWALWMSLKRRSATLLKPA
jgi:phytoene/squalene synthetase